MKTSNIKMIAILLSSIMLLSCGSDSDDPITKTEQEIMAEAIAKTWTVGEAGITLDGDNVTADWQGFSIKLNADQTYTTTASGDEQPLVWPTSGAFTFPVASNPNVIMRSDGVQITLENITESNARMVFNITGRNEGGKFQGLLGEWIFNMN